MRKIDWRTWWREFGIIILDHLRHASGGGATKRKDIKYERSVRLASISLLTLIVGGLGGSSIGVAFRWNITKDLNTPQEATSTDNPVPKRSAANEKGCFDEGKWDLRFGSLSGNASAGESSYYYLDPQKVKGFLGYSEDFPLNTECKFSFIPRGSKAVNLAISIDKLYQVTVGDNDYRTVSLRASREIAGKLDPIKESRTNLTRPRLKENMTKGSAVDITLRQEFLDEKKFRVTIIVAPAEQESGEFVYEFYPSPQIYLEPLRFSIGLIREPGDKSEIAVSLLPPLPNPDISPNVQ